MNNMIKTIFTMCALCPVAATAQPAYSGGWILETVGPSIVSPSNSMMLIDLYAWFDPTVGWAFAAGSVVASAQDSSLTAEIEHLGSGWAPAIQIDPQTVQMLGGQLHLPSASILADPANPILFAQLVWSTTDFTPRTVDITTETLSFKLYESEFTATSVEIPLANLSEGFLQIEVIPAPATSLAFLGAAGAVGMRRRR